MLGHYLLTLHRSLSRHRLYAAISPAGRRHGESFDAPSAVVTPRHGPPEQVRWKREGGSLRLGASPDGRGFIARVSEGVI